jgi:predicted amidohydrolase YtcJ
MAAFLQMGDISVRRMIQSSAVVPIAIFGVVAMTSCANNREKADLIFHGGAILTMADASPVVEAVAVADGRVLAVGSADRILAVADSDTEVVDLVDRALMPGFIDAHGHFMETARVIDAADLGPPPLGSVSSIDDLVSTLERKVAVNGVAKDGWILGRGYDQRLFDEQRHPTTSDLDRISTRRPVMAIHSSGRVASLNSTALEVTDMKSEATEPTGVVREQEYFLVKKLIDQGIRPRELVERIARAGRYYARFGITTTQDGATDESEWRAMVEADRTTDLPVDVVCFPDGRNSDGWFLRWDRVRGKIDGRLRIGGASITLDRAPEAGGAWLSTPYENQPQARGKPYFSDDNEVYYLFHHFMSRGVQVMAHVNGDAAAEQMIAAVENAISMVGPGDYRPVMLYAHTVREDQLDRMARNGISPSFHSSHLFFWGDHFFDLSLGRDRARRFSPCRSAVKRGMRFTVHSDDISSSPNVLFAISAAVNRRSRGGRVLGDEQRIEITDALKSVTSWAAWQVFEEDRKGSIEVGKLADLVVLSDDPLNTKPEDLDQIEVIATYKEGRQVYQAP